ncbi:MAG TPA: wax ester/triacylglycerol synthase family O-acyltransferase [Steroidobacteraceae bacterium]|nr:wax ester/triacylglycerol synthase family O-acyltransferase [Steroidobacteraceae bacterium]
MKTLSGLDGMFLHLETPETPMHVGSLIVLQLPKGYRGDFLADVKRLYARRAALAPVLKRTLRELPLQLANPAWVQADTLDLDYHFRRVVLPKPGTQAQLEACVGHLHSVPLDRAHPLWSVTIIEGLPGRKVGYYTNIHHAVIDGQSGVELAKVVFDQTPRPRRMPRMLADAAHGEHPWPGAAVAGALRHDAAQLAKLVQHLPEITRTIAAMRRAASRVGTEEPARTERRFAPRTTFNAAIRAARGFAGVSIPLGEVHRIAAAHRATVNDVVLAICAGALRRYLGRHGGVPLDSLIAAVPISLREAGNVEYTTLATMARVSLATDVADPVRRLHAIRDAASAAKAATGRARSILPTDFPTLGLPWLLHGLATLYGAAHLADVVPPLFNLVISNVRGPPMPLYIAGARVVRYWPLSIVAQGLGINITVESYAGSLEFGVTTAASAVRNPRALGAALLAAHRQLLARTIRGRPGRGKTRTRAVRGLG